MKCLHIACSDIAKTASLGELSPATVTMHSITISYLLYYWFAQEVLHEPDSMDTGHKLLLDDMAALQRIQE